MVEIVSIDKRENSEELRKLFESSFNMKIDKKKWEWKHLKNPYEEDFNYQLIVAKEKNEIVGARPLLIAKLTAPNNQTLITGQPCDTMVHPDHRRKGIFSRMNDYAIKYFSNKNMCMFYNFPNEKSKPGYLKQGWKITNQIRELTLIINPINLAKLKFLPKKNNTITKEKIRVDNTINNNIADKTPIKNNIKLITNNNISLLRTYDYIKWRVDDNSSLNCLYLYIEKDDLINTFFILNIIRQKNGIKKGEILDYSYNDMNNFESLLNDSINIFRLNKCDYCSIWTKENSKNYLLNKYKFTDRFSEPIDFVQNIFNKKYETEYKMCFDISKIYSDFT